MIFIFILKTANTLAKVNQIKGTILVPKMDISMNQIKVVSNLGT
jgi:hypothetical protein